MTPTAEFLDRKITPEQKARIRESLAGEGYPGGWAIMFDTEHPEFPDGLYFAAIVNEGYILPEFGREPDKLTITAKRRDGGKPIQIAVIPEAVDATTWISVEQMGVEFYRWLKSDN